MRRALLILFLGTFLQKAVAEDQGSCSSGSSFAKHICHRWHQIWEEGDNELYLTGYAWHNRYAYEKSKLGRYNEEAWGGGLGKGFYDEDGDWHGLYAFAFLDSHKNVEPIAGYSFLKVLYLNKNTHVGAGYTLLVTARPDIFHNIPFPGVLPWVSFTYRKVTFNASYVPGSRGVGNVLFVLAKITF